MLRQTIFIAFLSLVVLVLYPNAVIRVSAGDINTPITKRDTSQISFLSSLYETEILGNPLGGNSEQISYRVKMPSIDVSTRCNTPRKNSLALDITFGSRSSSVEGISMINVSSILGKYCLTLTVQLG